MLALIVVILAIIALLVIVVDQLRQGKPLSD